MLSVDTDWTTSDTWECDPRSVAGARAFVCSNLVERGLAHLVNDSRLIVSELATNAVFHAATPFTVTLRQVGDTVEILVLDGSSELPTLYPRAGEELLDLGLGLYLTDAYSHRWGVIRDADAGKTVWASLVATA